MGKIARPKPFAPFSPFKGRKLVYGPLPFCSNPPTLLPVINDRSLVHRQRNKQPILFHMKSQNK